MISKILFTIGVIVAIWKAFSLFTRLQKEGGIFARNTARQPPQRHGTQQQAKVKAVEMKLCPRCGAYIDPREGCTCTTPGA